MGAIADAFRIRKEDEVQAMENRDPIRDRNRNRNRSSASTPQSFLERGGAMERRDMSPLFLLATEWLGGGPSVNRRVAGDELA